MTMEREKFSVHIECPHCGQPGLVGWEESGVNDRSRGAERKLVSLSKGFHSESGRTLSGDPVIVCDACDQIQAD